MPMAKTGYVTARVEIDLKNRAEAVLHGLGVSTTHAITMFLHQVVLRRGLPFEVRVPNDAARQGAGEVSRPRKKARGGNGTGKVMREEFIRRDGRQV